MVLVTTCEICATPKQWQREDEMTLLYSTFVICPVCKKASKVTKELKDNIIMYRHNFFLEE